MAITLIDLMRRDTIIYVGGFILPSGNAAAQRVRNIAAGFKCLGYDVIFIDTQKDLKTKNILATYREIEGLKIYSVPYPRGIISWTLSVFSVSSFKNVLAEVQTVASIKAVIAYNYPFIGLYRMLKICRRKGILILSDATEWAVSPSFSFINLMKGIDTYFRMRYVHKKLDGMIVISSFLFGYYRNHFFKLVQIPPTVDKLDQKWKNRELPNDGILRFVYAGSPGNGMKDRIDKIIRSLDVASKFYNQRIRLSIIGINKGQFLETFKNKNLPEDMSFVVFMGKLPHEAALAEIAGADFSIFIRDKNRINTAGFPTKFVESVSCGTPVLCNESSNIKDYIEMEGLGFIIDISSESKLMESFKRVFNLTYEERVRLKEHCYNCQTFDFRVYRAKLEFLLTS